jgi:hypothetical protein
MPIFKVRPFRPWPLMAGSSIYFFLVFLGIFLFFFYFIFFKFMFILFFMHQAYGDSSFQDCKRASEEAMDTIIKNLQVYSSFSIKHMDG